jgi:hypothetical protein
LEDRLDEDSGMNEKDIMTVLEGLNQKYFTWPTKKYYTIIKEWQKSMGRFRIQTMNQNNLPTL